MIEEYNGKAKCDIHTPFGRCEHKSIKYIFGITLCDNHYHILYNMNNNVVTKSEMTKIIEKRLEEEEE